MSFPLLTSLLCYRQFSELTENVERTENVEHSLAYKEWTRQNSPEKRTPGLELNNEQMFFVSYAQANCFNRNNENAFTQAIRGIVQENIKVNMALRQSSEFQKAFSCPASSNMVAKNRCQMY